jgi:hypothetical protein
MKDYLGKYVDHVYSIVEKEFEGLDAIYEDYLINLVGVSGVMTLKKEKLIESCGIVNMRQLYTLLPRK